MSLKIKNILDSTSLKIRDISLLLPSRDHTQVLAEDTPISPADALYLLTYDIFVQVGVDEKSVKFVLSVFRDIIEKYATEIAVELSSQKPGISKFIFLAITDNRWVSVYPYTPERVADMLDVTVSDQMIFPNPPVMSLSVNLGALYLRSFASVYGHDHVSLSDLIEVSNP